MDKNTAKKNINLEVNKIPCISLFLFFICVNHTYWHVERMTSFFPCMPYLFYIVYILPNILADCACTP